MSAEVEGSPTVNELAVAEASRIESQFTATLNHELRTPLTTVIGMVWLLEGTDLDEEQRRYTARIGAAGEKLLTLVEAHMGDVDVQASRGEPAGTGTPRRGGRVLLVEDSVVNQQVISQVVEKLHYRTHVVANGQEALDALAAQTYDAVLMDCQMPVMDGFEATRRLREREGTTRRTPVIALTAGPPSEYRQRCDAAGMDDFVSKPASAETLAEVLDRWITVPSEEGAPDLPEPFADARGDRGRLVTLFLTETSAEAATIANANDSRDAVALTAAAHRLRGAAATFGADELARLAGNVEQIGAAGDLPVPHETVGGLERELDAVHRTVRATATQDSRDRGQMAAAPWEWVDAVGFPPER